MAGFLGNIGNFLTGGFTGGTGGGLGGLLSGITGSTNPLNDVMALLSFINEGQLTQEQMGFIQNVLGQQTGAMNVAGNPNRVSAFRTAETPPQITPGQFAGDVSQLTPPSWTPSQYSNTVNQLTQPLSQALTYSTLNPVKASLAAQGQNESAPTQQYVSQQALAPFVQQNQQLAESGANQLMSQQEQNYGYGLQGAGQVLNQNLSQEQLGQALAQFGLQLPFSANPVYPTFSYQNPVDLSSLNDLLGNGGTSGTFDTSGFGGNFLGSASNSNPFSNTSALALNQFLPGVSP